MTAGNGGSDPIALPESEARYLRLSLMDGPRGRLRLSEVAIEPLAFSATPNDFIKAVAKRRAARLRIRAASSASSRTGPSSASTAAASRA